MSARLTWIRSPRFLLAVAALVVLAAVGYHMWADHQARAILQRAEAALDERLYHKAGDLFAEYLARHPGDARAHLLAAKAARRLRDWSKAARLLERAGELGGAATAEAVDIERDLMAVQHGDVGPIPALRQRALIEDETALAILEVLIQFDLDTYDLRRALHGLNEFLRRRPGDLQALLARGYVWERDLSFSDAVEDYQKAVAAHPDSEPARLKLGAALLIAGTPHEALEHYQWLAERWPARPEVRLGLAKGWRLTGARDQAERSLDALLAELPEHGEGLWERGQLELDQGRAGAAEPYLRRAVAAAPFDRRFQYSLYSCLLVLKRTEEADQVNAQVAQIDADLRRLAKIRHEVMQRPEDADLRCEGGLIFLRHGEHREAARWLALALRFDPNCAAARAGLQELEASARRLPQMNKK